MVRGPLMSGCPRFAVASGKGPCWSQDSGEYFVDWTVAPRMDMVSRCQERGDEDVPAVVASVRGLSHRQAVVCKPSEFSQPHRTLVGSPCWWTYSLISRAASSSSFYFSTLPSHAAFRFQRVALSQQITSHRDPQTTHLCTRRITHPLVRLRQSFYGTVAFKHAMAFAVWRCLWESM